MTDSAALPDAIAPATRDIALREWREGWPVVVAGIFGFMLLSLGMMSMGAFMAPMQKAFGWSRTDYSIGLSVYAVAGVFLAPLVGAVIDRYDTRLVAVTGSLAVGVSFSLFATVDGSLGTWFALWLLYAVANQLIMLTIWSSAVARAFAVSRGLAISVTMFGSAAAAVVAPILANWLIEDYGFRTAFVAMGVGGGGLVAAVSWFAFASEKQRRTAAMASEAPTVPLSGMTLSEGLRSPIFVKLALVLFVTYLMVLSISVHLIPLLTAAGLSRAAAVFVGGSYGVSMILGKVIAGMAIDRFSGRLVAALFIALLAAALAMLALPAQSLASAIVAVFLYGLSFGGIAPIYPYLTSRYFGLRSFGKLFGVLTALYSLAYAVGPLLAGRIFDLTRSYFLFLTGAIPAVLLAVALVVSLGPYPDFAGRRGS